MRLFAFYILVAFLVLGRGPLCQAALLSKAVGTVSDRVLTSREVLISNVVERAMNEAPSFEPLEDLEGELFKREVSQSLLEWMVFMEADSFSVAALTPAEKTAGEEKLANYLRVNGRAAAAWRSLAPTPAERAMQIGRKLRAKKFIQFKSKSSLVPVTDREALVYFQQNRAKFGTMPFDKFKDSIKTYLSQQQADQRLREWFQILQKKYSVRHFLMEKGV